MRRRKQRISFEWRKFFHRFRFEKKHFVIAGGVLGVALIVVLAVLLIPRTITLEKGTLSFSLDSKGMIVRNESLYQMDINGKSEFIVEEGQTVAQGDEIATVYSSDYNENIVQDLKSCQEKILDYLRNNLLKDILNQDLSNMDAQIKELTISIQEQMKAGTDGDLLQKEKELKNLMEERQSFLREQVHVDAELTKYYEEEAALQARIDGWKKSSVAEHDGVVSFYFDGAETLLTPQNMMKLSAEEILNILDGKSYYTLTGSNTARPLYRLVKQNEWYAVVVQNAPVEEFETDATFKVVFPTEKNSIYTAQIISEKREGSKTIYYFAFSEPIGDLLITRNVDMTISEEYAGFRVPIGAIKKQDEQDGIYVKNGENKAFVPVEILIKKQGYAIVEEKGESDFLQEGCRIYS